MGRFSRLLLPMPLPGRLSLAPCQFVLSPSLWLTAYLSTVGVVHCAYCSTLFLHCQEDFFFFRLVLSVDLSSRRELVAHRVRPVRCSEFFHPIHLALQMDSFRNVWGGVPCGVPSVSSLTVHIVSRCSYSVNKKFEIFWGEILFAWYTIPP